MLRILAIGDVADNILTIKKFSSNINIHLIDFPKKGVDKITTSKDQVEYFDSILISKQVKKINKMKYDFDLCLVMGWAAARIAYLAGLNYVIFFMGGDIMTPPFEKNTTLSYLKEPTFQKNFIERKFYRKILDSAVACIVGTNEYHNKLKKFRDDAIRFDFAIVDTELFNPNIKPINMPKKKFTFLSAQRFGLEKGFDIIWEALKLCKSDFEFLQVQWFIEKTTIEDPQNVGDINKKLLKEIPKQVKFIPLIKRSDIGAYFMYADAIFGQVRSGAQGGIERDAAYCKKPVISFTDPNRPQIVNGKKIIPPFLPQSNDPIELAKIIDLVVDSKQFREKLAEEEYQYVNIISNPKEVVGEWKKIFEKLITTHNSINRDGSQIKLKIENLIVKFFEKFVYNIIMKEKNIQVFGKDEYEQLTK